MNYLQTCPQLNSKKKKSIIRISNLEKPPTLKTKVGGLKNKVARKPCSVLDNHLSGIRIAPNL